MAEYPYEPPAPAIRAQDQARIKELEAENQKLISGLGQVDILTLENFELEARVKELEALVSELTAEREELEHAADERCKSDLEGYSLTEYARRAAIR